MTPRARFLFWDYARGSVPYDVVCVILLILVFLAPASWWADPMVPRP
jgi:hypothetical protein